jgi:hypothetical protein
MEKQIYAVYDDERIRVYQAYNDWIAEEALQKGRFGSRFKRERMTWIKPSFLWMMYRAGWASKEGQTRILGIDLKREGFDYIVNHGVSSSYSKEQFSGKEDWKEKLKRAEVRCQWDPERDAYGNPLARRSIQLGIRGEMVRRYVEEWTLGITDLTPEVREIKERIDAGRPYQERLPRERKYFVASPQCNEQK